MKKMLYVAVVGCLLISFTSCKEAEETIDDLNSQISKVENDGKSEVSEGISEVESDISKIESNMDSDASELLSGIESGVSEIESKADGRDKT